MKGKRLIKKTLFTLALLCFTIMPLWAQEEFETDAPDTTTTASIDGSLPILLIVAIGLGYMFLNRKLRNTKI